MKTLELLRIFTEPQRLRILALLRKSSLSVTELKDILNFSQSNISHHLKILKDLTLIDYQRLGNQKYYLSTFREDLPPHIKELAGDLDNLLKEIPESKEDEKNLIAALNRRKDTDHKELFTSWRKLQPDLPYTAEVALEGLKKGELALDIGCGTGEFINFIHKQFEKIIGIDISLSHLETAGELLKKHPHVMLLLADSHAIPLPENTVESAYLRMTLRFLKEPDSALTEIGSKLKPGGKISIIDLEPTGSKLFTKEYFQDFCRKHPNYTLANYKTYPKLFLTSIEKLA